MNNRLIIVVLLIWLVAGCSSVRKSMQASYAGEYQKEQSQSAVELASSQSSSRDSVLSTVETHSQKIATKIEIVEEYDTAKGIDSTTGRPPLSKRKTTLESEEGICTEYLNLSQTHREEERDTLYASAEIDDSASASVDSSVKAKEKKGGSFLDKLLRRLGIGVLIFIVLKVLYKYFKPNINSVVTIIKNFLKL